MIHEQPENSDVIWDFPMSPSSFVIVTDRNFKRPVIPSLWYMTPSSANRLNTIVLKEVVGSSRTVTILSFILFTF